MRYSKFGAVGDGKTNDMQAIAATHQYANAKGLRVEADEGFVYYISDVAESAIIQTDTDWTGARFVIDDSNVGIDKSSDNVFVVMPSQPIYTLISGGIPVDPQYTIQSLARHQENIGISLPQDSVLVIYDKNVRRYIRKGKNADKGSEQMEIVLVDSDGNVSPSSPIIWDYPEVTDVFVYPVDPNVLSITGGSFTTIANQVDSPEYYNRGIKVMRSNVVVDGLSHDIEGELGYGAPYNGFLTLFYAANVTVKNSIFTAHRAYPVEPGSAILKGSYDFQPTGIINLLIENCEQTSDIMDASRFGIMGSNYCKNITLRDCIFNRFDAHKGVVNTSIIGTTLGYNGIEIIGEGLLTIKDSTIRSYSFITLRDDYGSTWHGNLRIEHSTWMPLVTLLPMSMIFGINDGDHDFGYECYMPTVIDIDDLTVEDGAVGIYLFGNITKDNTSADFTYAYPYHITQTVNISNYHSASGKKWMLSSNEYMFKDVEINE